MTPQFLIWALAGLAIAGAALRPWRLSPALWPALASALLGVTGLLGWSALLHGIARGANVYLFLAGMMLLAQLARSEGLFDWLAAHAALRARGSARRLFGLIYLIGIPVTVFLSNDATAVVLTPAVASAARAAGFANPLPFLLICAFLANAASFVLPISNPANLVIYGSGMPPLLSWVQRFILPSVAAILATFLALRWAERHALRQSGSHDRAPPALPVSGRFTGYGIVGMGALLMLASGFGLPLGLPTCVAALLTLAAVLAAGRRPGLLPEVIRDISWDVLVLVAGLFVLVQAMEATGVITQLHSLFYHAVRQNPGLAAWESGIAVALLSNLANNLPVGLLAGQAASGGQLPPNVVSAMLIGVDIGPNLSVTGSLATILWLDALRQEGIEVTGWQFIKLGALVMPPALLLALITTIG